MTNGWQCGSGTVCHTRSAEFPELEDIASRDIAVLESSAKAPSYTSCCTNGERANYSCSDNIFRMCHLVFGLDALACSPKPDDSLEAQQHRRTRRAVAPPAGGHERFLGFPRFLKFLAWSCSRRGLHRTATAVCSVPVRRPHAGRSSRTGNLEQYNSCCRSLLQEASHGTWLHAGIFFFSFLF